MRNVLALWLLCFCSWVWADAGTTKGWPTKKSEVNAGVGCHIALELPDDRALPHGSVSVAVSRGVTVGDPLPKSWRSTLNELYFSLSCQASDDPDTKGGTYPIAYDEVKNKWGKDASNWEKEARALANKDDQKALRELIRVTNVFNVNATNSQGWAMTQDDTTGDERGRRRTLSFCLTLDVIKHF